MHCELFVGVQDSVAYVVVKATISSLLSPPFSIIYTLTSIQQAYPTHAPVSDIRVLTTTKATYLYNLISL